MEDYLTAGIVLIVISTGSLVYVLVTVPVNPQGLIVITRQTFFWRLLQISASLLSGILGGYFLGVHKERKKTPSAQRISQDSSAQA